MDIANGLARVGKAVLIAAGLSALFLGSTVTWSKETAVSKGQGGMTAAPALQNARMFLMSASSDFIVGPLFNQGPAFDSTHVPVFWGTLQGAGHFVPVGSVGGYRGPSTGWSRLYLTQDQTAASHFYGADCILCQSPQWTGLEGDLP